MSDTMTNRRIVQKFAKQHLVVSEELDEYVHDCASKTASRINNGGVESQIDFLVDELGPIETQTIINNIVNGRGNGY